jgi:predicted dehydrogenase
VSPLGVGVIGASPLSPGWASVAHLPAIQALPDFELRAVSTSRRESAEAAARAYGVPAFDSAAGLLAHPGVDLVVVAVKAPDHAPLVRAALEAGKAVFCEWPLGVSLAEAEELAARARAAGVRTAIGLQAGFAPAVQHARELVAQGYVGEVLGTTLVGSGMVWGAESRRASAFWFDLASGSHLVAVPLLHALEALTYVLGDFDSVAATSALRRPEVRITEDGSTFRATAPEHIAVSGRLRSGALVSTYYRGPVSRGENLRWEINGTEGDLVLTAANGNLQVADLELRGGRGAQTAVAPLELPEHLAHSPGGLAGGPGANTLREYAALARDLREGTHRVPDFDDAVRQHRLLAAIQEAARSGLTQRLDGVGAGVAGGAP